MQYSVIVKSKEELPDWLATIVAGELLQDKQVHSVNLDKHGRQYFRSDGEYILYHWEAEQLDASAELVTDNKIIGVLSELDYDKVYPVDQLVIDQLLGFVFKDNRWGNLLNYIHLFQYVPDFWCVDLTYTTSEKLWTHPQYVLKSKKSFKTLFNTIKKEIPDRTKGGHMDYSCYYSPYTGEFAADERSEWKALLMFELLCDKENVIDVITGGIAELRKRSPQCARKLAKLCSLFDNRMPTNSGKVLKHLQEEGYINCKDFILSLSSKGKKELLKIHQILES